MVVEINTYTDSAWQDKVVEEVAAFCDFAEIPDTFHFKFYTPDHKRLLAQWCQTKPHNAHRILSRAIREGVFLHIKRQIVAREIPDLASARAYVPNRDDVGDAEIMIIARKQMGARRSMTEKDRVLDLHTVKRLKLGTVISEQIYPIIPLSKINATMVSRPVQLDCALVGVGQQKLLPVEVETETGGRKSPDDYSLKNDGAILNTWYADVQDVLIEEILDNPEPGQVSRKVTLKLYNDECSRYNSGDKLRILGMYAENEEDTQKIERRAVIHAVSIQRWKDEKDVTLSEFDLAHFRTMAAQDPSDYITKVTESFVPHVLGNKYQKAALILCVVKSTKMEGDRDNIHLILNDVPGNAKSDLLKGAVDFVQSSTYVDAPNATARGLLYGQEDFEKTKILREGVMLRYRVVFLDEFDKIASWERKAINLAAQQQVAIYTKVPFHETKALDVSIIAAANPKNEKWIDERSTMENLAPLEPSIISRFVVSKMEHLEDTDNFVDFKTGAANAVLKNEALFTAAQIKGLINHCRNQTPTWSPEGRQILKEYLKSFRTIQQYEDFDLPIDKRKEVDVMRLCSATAKLLMQDTVDAFAVRFAVDLYRYTLKSIGLNTDAPTVQTSMADNDLPKVASFDFIFDAIVNEHHEVNETELKVEMSKSGKWKTPHQIDGFIRTMYKEGVIYEPRPGFYKRISR